MRSLWRRGRRCYGHRWSRRRRRGGGLCSHRRTDRFADRRTQWRAEPAGDGGARLVERFRGLFGRRFRLDRGHFGPRFGLHSLPRRCIVLDRRGRLFRLMLVLCIAVISAAARPVRVGRAQHLFDGDGYILIDRAGVRLLLLDAQARQQLEDPVRFHFEFPSQLVNSDLQLHRWVNCARAVFRQQPFRIQKYRPFSPPGPRPSV